MAAPAPVREKPADAAHPPEGTPTRRIGAGLLDPQQLWRALPAALRKLNPVTLARNPVMFVTEIGVAMNDEHGTSAANEAGRCGCSATTWAAMVLTSSRRVKSAPTVHSRSASMPAVVTRQSAAARASSEMRPCRTRSYRDRRAAGRSPGRCRKWRP